LNAVHAQPPVEDFFFSPGIEANMTVHPNLVNDLGGGWSIRQIRITRQCQRRGADHGGGPRSGPQSGQWS
jgi:hypothetical protein